MLHRKQWIVAGSMLVVTAALAAPALAAQAGPSSPGLDMPRLLAASLAWLTPAGFVLLAAAGAQDSRVWQAALGGVAGAALGVVLFFLVGFALAFGGIGLVQPNAPGYSELVWEWTLLAGEWGTRWGMAGMSGWALTGPAATPAAYELFFANLPWVATAAMIPLMALRGRTPALSSLLGGLLIGGLLYPLATNWVWGGGWLANLGVNLNLGHGFVDFAGGATVHLLAAGVGLAGLLTMVTRRPRRRDESAVPLPPVHLPLLAAMGALLILAGSLGWAWANPLLDPATLLPSRGLVNVVLAAVAGALAPLAYTWFVADHPDPLLAARGLAAGAVIAAATGPFIPPWAAAALGLAAGLLTPLLTYLVREVLRIDDDTGLAPVHLAAGLLGVLAIGIFADGLAGAGWNGVGENAFLGVTGQGVTGLLAAPGMQPDWPGQVQAQLIGAGALFALGLLSAIAVFGLLAVLARGLRMARNARPADAVEPAPVAADSPAAESSGEVAMAEMGADV
jgi:ammonium transporter, Amt family